MRSALIVIGVLGVVLASCANGAWSYVVGSYDKHAGLTHLR